MTSKKKKELMAHARQMRAAKTQARKERDEIVAAAVALAREAYPEAEEIMVTMHGQPLSPIIFIRDKGETRARAHRLKA